MLTAWAEKSQPGDAIPAEDFLAARTKIFDEFKATPLAEMHRTCDLQTAIDNLLKEETLWI